MSNPLRPHGLWPTRLRPWDFPGNNTGVGYHFLFQGIFWIQGLNPCLLHWQEDSLPLSHQGSLQYIFITIQKHYTTSSKVQIPYCIVFLFPLPFLIILLTFILFNFVTETAAIIILDSYLANQLRVINKRFYFTFTCSSHIIFL